MPVTLDAAKSGAAANSYVTVADADTYFNNLFLADTWAEMDADTKARLLITATMQIDALPVIYGKMDPAQALNFPVNTTLIAGNPPIEAGWGDVQSATLAQAIYLLRYGETIVGAVEEGIQNMESQSLGRVSMSKSASSMNPFRKYDPAVFRWLSDFIDMGASIYRG